MNYMNLNYLGVIQTKMASPTSGTDVCMVALFKAKCVASHNGSILAAQIMRGTEPCAQTFRNDIVEYLNKILVEVLAYVTVNCQ
jgi:hypothetical protein